MVKETDKKSSRRLWRLALIALIAVPFVPVISVYAMAALARVAGCRIDQSGECLIGSVSAGDFIVAASNAALIIGTIFWFIVPVWLASCYFVVTQGWARTGSRLPLAFAVSMIFAFLPYCAPLLLINSLSSSDCSILPCRIFGGDLGNDVAKHAPDIASVGTLVGLVIALAMFALYAIGTGIVRVVSWRRTTTPAE
jgi:hypothetical protein